MDRELKSKERSESARTERREVGGFGEMDDGGRFLVVGVEE